MKVLQDEWGKIKRSFCHPDMFCVTMIIFFVIIVANVFGFLLSKAF